MIGYVFLFSLLIATMPLQGAESVRGFLVYGHEVRTFQPCHDRRTFWVEAPPNLHLPLLQQYRKTAATPYEPVAVEVTGTFGAPLTGEFSKDYAGTLHLQGPPRFLAGGEEICKQTPKAVFMFVCDDRSRYVVEASYHQAWVFMPGNGLRLHRLTGETGRVYGNDGFRMHIEGDSARIRENAASSWKRCRNDYRAVPWEAAKLSGADFRAVGNEPGWVLILKGDRLVLETDYGNRRIDATLPKPVTDPETRTTRWQTQDLTLELTPGPCFDAMSGERFETRVTVHLPGQTLHGCGRPLH